MFEYEKIYKWWRVVSSGEAMKSWSSTQGSVATSVAEAEYYAALKGAAEALGFASLARDLGYELKVILWSDSTAARGVAARKGLSSRTHHMEVKFLWLQGALAKGQLDWKKVHTLCQPTAIGAGGWRTSCNPVGPILAG